jgi:hypothetical protein
MILYPPIEVPKDMTKEHKTINHKGTTKNGLVGFTLRQLLFPAKKQQ